MTHTPSGDRLLPSIEDLHPDQPWMSSCPLGLTLDSADRILRQLPPDVLRGIGARLIDYTNKQPASPALPAPTPGVLYRGRYYDVLPPHTLPGLSAIPC